MSREITAVETPNPQIVTNSTESQDQSRIPRSIPHSDLRDQAPELRLLAAASQTVSSSQSSLIVSGTQTWSGSPQPSSVGSTWSDMGSDGGFITLDALEQRCQQQPTDYLVEGLLPAEDLHVAVGDSGLGKTPWAYQLGLCVATGTALYGHACRKGKVLYYDMENGPEQILDIARGLRTYLGIRRFPTDFLLFPGDAHAPELSSAVALHRPDLVIVDTMRALWPEAESTNDQMGNLLKKLRSTAREYRCAILLVHHIRKPMLGRTGSFKHKPPALQDASTLEWLQQAAGARALINHTNTRIAFDIPRASSGAALVVKAFIKVKGERGPELLSRVIDPETGEPVAYERIVGTQLLNNSDQASAYGRLPRRFSFKEAKQVYGKTDNPTREWLLKCEAAGLVRQTGRGTYEKSGASDSQPDDPASSKLDEVAEVTEVSS